MKRFTGTLLAAAATALTLPPAAARAQDTPPQLIEAAETAHALCASRGGEANILPGYRTEADLNGDGWISLPT